MGMELERIYENVRKQITFQPKAALILGSGLGNFADTVQIEETLDYHAIEGFPVSTVPGHKGRFIFEEQNLEQIMRALSRWYNFDYEFEDTSLANIVFKGSAPRYADLSEALSILEKSGGIGFRVQNEKIIITNNNKQND